MREVVWFSAGAASFTVAELKGTDNIVYIEIGGEHPDNLRFLTDCEKRWGQKIIRLKSDKYVSHWDVIEKCRYINGPKGARCTAELKRKPRLVWQRPTDINYMGFTVEEEHRAKRLKAMEPGIDIRYPLIERGLRKQDCLEMVRKSGIRMPAMYELGFHNNNCIGCVKGGKGYWWKIKREFPDAFQRMVEAEERIGATCIRGLKLKDLKPTKYREVEPCDLFCLAATPKKEGE